MPKKPWKLALQARQPGGGRTPEGDTPGPTGTRQKYPDRAFWATAYTDASVREGRSAWAVWIKSEHGRIIKGGASPEWIDNSWTAEMYAIFQALKLTHEAWPQVKGIFINSDHQDVLVRLWPWSEEPRHSGGRQALRLVREYAREHGLEIRTKHVKGHQRIHDVRSYLNNQVDRLAGRFSREEFLPQEFLDSIEDDLPEVHDYDARDDYRK